MLYTGTFTEGDITYHLAICETPQAKRLDIFKTDMLLKDTSSNNLISSVVVNKMKASKRFFGDIDLYYRVERHIRKGRLTSFSGDQIETVEDFEEGKYIFKCTQSNGEVTFNFTSENNENIYTLIETSSTKYEVALTDESYASTNEHATVPYQPEQTSASGIDKDSLMLSRIATVAELRRKYDLSWLDEGKEYVDVLSTSSLRQWMNRFKQFVANHPNPEEVVLAVDTETSGLNVYNVPAESGEKDFIVCIVLSWREDFSLHIPLAYEEGINLDIKEVLEILEPYLTQFPILTQYGQFDYKVFMEYRVKPFLPIKLNIKEDLILQNYIIQPNPAYSTRSLKDNVWKHLKIKQLALTDLFPSTKEFGKSDIQFQLLNRELAILYACPDVDNLIKLHKIIKPRVPDVSIPIYNVETEFMPIAAEAEYYGLRVDMATFRKEKRLCEMIVDDLQNVIYRMAGYKFNLNSPDQVGHFLYDKLGCEILIASKTNPNKGSTSSRALENLAKVKLEEPIVRLTGNLEIVVQGEEKPRVICYADEINSLKYPAVAILIQYRNYSKLLSSFFNSIETSNKGGRLFSWINQTGAQSGRIISPLQTLPAFIKKMIVPDTSDFGFIVMDYKQIELRLMFGLAKETELIELCNNPANDIHRIAAGRIYKKELWEIFKDLRSKTKGLNFGIPYSLGDVNLAITLYGLPRNEEHLKEIVAMAQDDKRRFFEAMPRVERLFIDAKETVRKYGCIYTLFGRGYYYEGIFGETNRGKIARVLRQAGNSMIQGLGADVFKTGSTKFQRRIVERGWDHLVETINPETGNSEGWYPYVRQAFFVHDELGTPYHKKTINPVQVIYELVNTMQMHIPGFPPLFIGPAVVKNWGDAKEDKYEIPTELLNKWCGEVEQGMHTEPLENPEEWVYEQIVNFNRAEYTTYLNELKAQVEESGQPVTAENIAKLFRHDTITHDFLGMYKAKDYEAEYGRKPSDVELVEYCCIRYINDNNFLSTVVSLDEAKQSRAPVNTDSVLANLIATAQQDSKRTHLQLITEDALTEKEHDRNFHIEMANELDEFSNPLDTYDEFDLADGYDDEYTEEYYKYHKGAISEIEYIKRKEEIQTGFSDVVFTVSRKKIINLDLVTADIAASIITYIKDSHRDDGLYDVEFIHGGNTMTTKLKVDKLDETLIDLLVKKSREQTG